MADDGHQLDITHSDVVFRRIVKLRQSILAAEEPTQVIKILRVCDTIEDAMRNAGLYSTDKIRPANEARFEARWKLGQLLAKMERRRSRKRVNVTY